MDVVKKFHSGWRKPIRAVRFCLDYRKVIAVSKSDAFLMPHIDELLSQLGIASFYSSLDLTKGYWLSWNSSCVKAVVTITHNFSIN